MADSATSPPPSPRLPQGLKRSASSHMHDRLEAVRPLSRNKRSRRGSLSTTGPPSKPVSPFFQYSQCTIPLLLQEQTNGSIRSNDGDSITSEAENQEASSSRDDVEPIDLLPSEPLLEWFFTPSCVGEATANTRSTSEVWHFIQPHLRGLVREKTSTDTPRFTIKFDLGPNEADMDMLEVMAFNQILQLPWQRTIAGNLTWWKYLETQYRTSTRHYHVVMAILIYVVGEQLPTQCTSCQHHGLPGCYTLPESLMQPELAQVVGSTCCNCIMRKKRGICDTRPRCTTTPALGKSNESQRSVSVPCSSDHTLPVGRPASPTPGNYQANIGTTSQAGSHLSVSSADMSEELSERATISAGCRSLAMTIGKFKTVEAQREFISSVLVLLTKSGPDNDLMDPIIDALHLSEPEREEIVSGLREWLPMTPVKRLIAHLARLVDEQPEGLHSILSHAIVESLSLPDICHQGMFAAHGLLLGPDYDRQIAMTLLESFHDGYLTAAEADLD